MHFLHCVVLLLICTSMRSSMGASDVLDLFPEFHELSNKVGRLESGLKLELNDVKSSVKILEDPVAFSAFFSESAASKSTDIKKGSTFVFDRTVFNKGSAYSISTGKFTAPSSGTYAFTWTICVDADYYDGGYGEYATSLVVGSTVQGKLHVDTEVEDDEECATGFTIANVKSGQEVYIRCLGDNQGKILSREYLTRTTFSGWKI